MAEYFKIGKLVAVHGLKGELVLKHFLGKKTTLKGLETVFIEAKKNEFLPWFIESSSLKNESEIYLKFETVDNREAAMRLVQKELWVQQEVIRKFADKSAPVSLLGYTIINESEPLGEILEVIEQPHQLLCRLEIQSKEVLIPVHEASLQKIDHKKKQVVVNLPEGLLDVYLK